MTSVAPMPAGPELWAAIAQASVSKELLLIAATVAVLAVTVRARLHLGTGRRPGLGVGQPRDAQRTNADGWDWSVGDLGVVRRSLHVEILGGRHHGAAGQIGLRHGFLFNEADRRADRSASHGADAGEHGEVEHLAGIDVDVVPSSDGGAADERGRPARHVAVADGIGHLFARRVIVQRRARSTD